MNERTNRPIQARGSRSANPATEEGHLMPKRAPKPAPVVVTTICSICGEDWAQHQEVDGEVSTLECVRLLKAKIAAQPTVIFQRTWPTVTTYPYIPNQTWPQITYTGGGNCSGNISTQYVSNTNDNSPVVALASVA